MYSNFCAKNSLKYIFSSLKALGADELMSWSTADSERARHQICVRKARKRSGNAVLRDSRNGSSDPHQLHSD